MTENQGVKIRLITYLNSRNIKKSHFEKGLGLCNGYINSIKKSISAKRLGQISKAYPDLNISWLMTGEGEMLRVKTYETKAEDEKAQSGGETDYKKMYEEARKNLEALRLLYESEKEQSKLKDVTIATLQKLVEVIDKKHSEGGSRGDV